MFVYLVELQDALHPSSGRIIEMPQMLLVLVTAVWGSTFVVVAQTVTSVSPIHFMALRFSIAALALLPWAIGASGPWPWKRAIWAGIWLFVAFYLQTRGLQQTGPDRAAFITSLNVLFVPIGEWAAYRVPIHRSLWIAGVTALFGLALVLRPTVSGINTGDILVLGTAITLVAQILASDRLPAGTSIMRFTWIEITVSAGLSWVGSLTNPTWNLSTATWVAALYTGILASAFAYWAQTWAQTRLRPFETALIFLLEPIFATIIGVWAANRPWTVRELLGAMIVIASLVGFEWYRASRPLANSP